MNTARKFIHEESYKQLDSLELKNVSLLSDLVLSSDESIVIAIDYWRTELQNADDTRKAVCRGQIDILERNMMAKAIIIEDLLGSVELTGGIPTLVEKSQNVEPLVNETQSVEELETKEVPVIDIATGKPVEETPVAETTEPVKETVAEEIKPITVEERKTLEVIKAEVTVLIQSGKKDEGLELFKSYMLNGMWLGKNGKAGKPWNNKELKNAWDNLLKKTEMTVIQKHVESTEKKDEPVVTAETDIKSHDDITPEVLAKEELDFDKAKLALDETNLKTYQKFYPEDKESEKNVVIFTKAILNVTEEEKAIQKVYGEVCKLFNDNKLNDATELTRLFFSERAYDDAQIGKWLAAAQAKTVVENQLAFLVDKTTLQATNDIAEMVKMATEAVQKDNVSQDTLKAWFKDNVWDKVVVGFEKVISDEDTLNDKFKAIFNWLFEKKAAPSPEALLAATEIITAKLKEVKAGEQTMLDVTSPVKKALKEKGFDFKINELMPKIKEIALTVNPEFIKAYENRKTAFGGKSQKNDDIKPNKEFETPAPIAPDPTIESPGKEEITPSTTETTEPVTTPEAAPEAVDAVIEFKTLEDLTYHLSTMKRDNSDVATVTTEAMHYLIDINAIDDAKDWTPEMVKGLVEGIFNPAPVEITDEKPVDAPGEVTPVVEAAPVETTPVVEAPVASTIPEVTVSETPVEPEKSATELGPDYKKIHQAMNGKQFEIAVREAFVSNKGDDTDDTRSFDAIINAIRTPNGGKYINQIHKNKVEEQMKQIKKIIYPSVK